MIQLVDSYFSTNNNYPDITLAVAERMRTFLTETLYSTDTDKVDGISPRVIIADIGATSDEGIRQATNTFGTNQNYPFTAYNFGEFEVVLDKKNSYGALKKYYDSDLDTFVYSVPLKQELLSITFCNNPSDYERVKKLMIEMSASLTLIYAPVVLNGVTYQLPVHVDLIPAKGQYAHAFVEYLRVNQIYDVVHNFNLYFQDIILDNNTIPIDDMTINSETIDSSNNEMTHGEETFNHPRTQLPVIVSTDPVDHETNVPVNNNVQINFNVTMLEDSVESALTIDPYFEFKPIWDDDSKILVLDPLYNLTSGTLYTLTIADTATAFYVYDTLEETEFSFTTDI